MKLEKAIERAKYIRDNFDLDGNDKEVISQVIEAAEESKMAYCCACGRTIESVKQAILSFLQKVIGREDGINELIAFLNGADSQLKAYIEKVLDKQ